MTAEPVAPPPSESTSNLSDPGDPSGAPIALADREERFVPAPKSWIKTMALKNWFDKPGGPALCTLNLVCGIAPVFSLQLKHALMLCSSTIRQAYTLPF